MRNDDTRCCGTGTCMINEEGVCWCGQRWDGEKMCPPNLQKVPPAEQSLESGLVEKQSGASNG